VPPNVRSRQIGRLLLG